jgi:sulfofructose kinase
MCAVDFSCRLPYYPSLDEKLEIDQFSFQGGGPVPTALVTLARLGAKTSYIGVVGDDEHGRFILSEFKYYGVDISGVVVDKNCASNKAFIWIDKSSGKKSIALNKNGIKELFPDEISTDHITSSRFLHIDGRDTEATLRAIRLAKERGVAVTLDAGSPRNRMKEILELVDYPIVSEAFCRDYLKTTDPYQGLEVLLKMGAKSAVVTLGVKGCYGATDSQVYFQPAYPVEVVDTTGAGDVFHGAFIYGLLNQWTLQQNLKFSAATAALKCTQLGGRSGIPTLEMVLNFINGKEKKQ